MTAASSASCVKDRRVLPVPIIGLLANSTEVTSMDDNAL